MPFYMNDRPTPAPYWEEAAPSPPRPRPSSLFGSSQTPANPHEQSPQPTNFIFHGQLNEIYRPGKTPPNASGTGLYGPAGYTTKPTHASIHSPDPHSSPALVGQPTPGDSQRGTYAGQNLDGQASFNSNSPYNAYSNGFGPPAYYQAHPNTAQPPPSPSPENNLASLTSRPPPPSTHPHCHGTQGLDQGNQGRDGVFAQSPAVVPPMHPHPNASPLVRPTPPADANHTVIHNPPDTTANSSGDVSKAQMHEEMRRMVDSLRLYKSQAPELFSQVWEDFKKTQIQPLARIQSSSPHEKQISISKDQTSPAQRNASSGGPKSSTQGPISAGPAAVGARPATDRAAASTVSASTQNGAKGAGKKRAVPDIAKGDGPQPRKRQAKPLDGEYRRPTSNEPSGAASSNGGQDSPVPGPRMGWFVPPEQDNQVSTSPNSILWPAKKRLAIANAAYHLLQSYPQNQGKVISTDEILGLLDRGLAYSDICNHLWTRGFYLDRSIFAKEILNAINAHEDGSKQQWSKLSSTPYVAVPQPTAASTSFPIKTVPSTKVNPSPGQQHPVVNATISSASHPVGLSPTVTGHGNPSNKIIDLDRMSEDEIALGRPMVPNEARISNTKNSMRPVSKQFVPPQPTASPRPPEKTRGDLLASKIVEPIDAKRDARRRSRYDPDTIARDVLLATGKHPHLVPLNYHLGVLRKRFGSVQSSSDLSTIKWDVIDPEPPPPPEPIQVVHNSQQPTFGMLLTSDITMNGLKGKFRSAKPRKSYNDSAKPPKRRGRPPKWFKEMQEKDRRAGITANVSVPSNMGASSSAPSMPIAPVLRSVETESTTPPIPYSSKGSGKAKTVLGNIQISPKEGCSSSAGVEPVTVASKSPMSPPRVPGRRGRPPGAKNKAPRSDLGVKKPPKIQHAARAGPSTPSSKVSGKSSSDPRRKSVGSKVISVIVPSRSPSISGTSPAQARSGALGNERSLSNGNSAPQTFQIFKCDWEGCPAELHDIKTLAKHLHEQHLVRAGSGPWPCRWRNCSDSTTTQRFQFAQAKDWDTHVYSSHLRAKIDGMELIDGLFDEFAMDSLLQ